MIPAAFEYERAESADHAVQLLGHYGDEAKLIAGGHSLLPLMKLRLARPSVLIDIDRLTDLEYVREADDKIEIGALTRIADVASNQLLAQHNPLVAFAAGEVGDPQVRHRATLGGSLAHGDPASDPPTVMLTLDAELVIRGPSGERTVPASRFFKSLFETDLGPQEVLTAVRVPKLASGMGWSYLKFHRRALDWAIVGVATVVERSNGQIAKAAIGLTNMGSTPLRAFAVEQALAGSQASDQAITTAAEHAPEGADPVTDTNASAEYRTELSKVLVRRAIQEALSR
ncbi:MAG TPA: xanthine dehydrogenase family protein subunit M [Actinomycetota bacterium]